MKYHKKKLYNLYTQDMLTGMQITAMEFALPLISVY